MKDKKHKYSNDTEASKYCNPNKWEGRLHIVKNYKPHKYGIPARELFKMGSLA